MMPIRLPLVRSFVSDAGAGALVALFVAWSGLVPTAAAATQDGAPTGNPANDRPFIAPHASAQQLLSLRDKAPGQVLRISYTSVTAPLNQDAQTAATTLEGTLVLAPDYFHYREGDTVRLFDFTLRRQAIVNPSSGTFSHSSLYADVGFRSYETRNRLMLAEMLERTGSSGPDHVVGDRFWIATELDMADKAPIADLNMETKADGTLQASYKGETVSVFRFSDRDLLPDLHRQLGHYLRYALAIHPHIVDRALQSGRMPSEIVATWFKGKDRVQTRIRFSAPVLVDGAYPVTADMRTEQDYVSRNAFIVAMHPAIGRAVAGDGWAAKNDPDVYADRIRQYIAEGKILDAQLVMLELGLTSPADLQCRDAQQRSRICAAVAMLQPHIQQDADTVRFFKYLNPQRSGVDKATAAKELVSLQRADLGAGHVLNLFIANHYADLFTGTGPADEQQGYFNKALHHYAKAIEGNPFMACMYHDIGKLYFRGFHPWEAWYFWDSGRALPSARQCHLLDRISAFEAGMPVRHPEFF